MKKNGFTLVELLCTICIIAMLSTIISPILVKKVNVAKEEALETLINTIENDSIDYVINNEDILDNFKNNDNIYITISDLINNNYFDQSLINPITKTPLLESDYIYVTRDYNGKIEAIYDINQSLKSKIELNGPYNVYLNASDTYNEYYVKVDGATTNIIPEGSVDTTTSGVYKLTYSYGTLSLQVQVSRNVIVE